jgi:aspartyl-tRNA(Asn)/glutamyl-tRNA(Gln) amidotransferase subunit A
MRWRLLVKPALLILGGDMDRDELCFTPATELARMIRDKQVSALEATEAVLSRIAEIEPHINAFITVCADEARAAAIAADAALAAGDDIGPLHGVPLGVKDLLNTKGVRTTFASHAFADNVPGADCVAMARLRAAGAILVGKTTTPEFGHKPMTEAPLFGQTRNPWNLERTAGGSSGGAGAAAATGLAPLHVGTDAGGSTRIPSAACGVVGMKQTLGLVPHDMNGETFGLFSFINPMTRTVADAGLMLSTMIGPHPSDIHSLGRAPAGDLARAARGEGDLKGVRVGWRLFLGNDVIDTETREIFEAALPAFEEMGAELIPYEGPFTPTLPIWKPIIFSSFAIRFTEMMEELGDKMSETLRYWTRMGGDYSAIDLQTAMQIRTQVFRQVQGWFEEVDLVVTPTLARPALPIDHDPREPVEIEGRLTDEPRAAWYPYTHPFNMTGHPAITLPSGWTKDGLPLGLQIVGPWLADDKVLHAAACFERARPWADRRPSL